MEYRGVGIHVTGNGRGDEDERAGDLLSHQPSLPRLLISYITTPDKGRDGEERQSRDYPDAKREPRDVFFTAAARLIELQNDQHQRAQQHSQGRHRVEWHWRICWLRQVFS